MQMPKAVGSRTVNLYCATVVVYYILGEGVVSSRKASANVCRTQMAAH